MKLFKDVNNNIFAYELDGSQDDLIGNKTLITDAEAETIRAEQQAARPYAQKRADEYPSIADQLDLLYNGGMDAWKAAIQAIKDKYPKD